MSHVKVPTIARAANVLEGSTGPRGCAALGHQLDEKMAPVQVEVTCVVERMRQSHAVRIVCQRRGEQCKAGVMVQEAMASEMAEPVRLQCAPQGGRKVPSFRYPGHPVSPCAVPRIRPHPEQAVLAVGEASRMRWWP